MNKLTFEKENGVAYYKFGDDVPYPHSLPIDSVEMLFTAAGVPVAFRIIISNLCEEWMSSWKELSPALFDEFQDKLRTLPGLRFEKGHHWFSDIPGPELLNVAASAYVDLDSNLVPQGIEFLFPTF